MSAISFPHTPSSANHPLWSAAVKEPEKPKVKREGPPPLIKKTRVPRNPLHTRHTTSTMARLMAGHAFTGEYSSRFHITLPEFHHGCPCGAALLSSRHLLYDFPQFTAECRAHGIVTSSGRPRPIGRLFTSAGPPFLDFLKATRVAFKPEVGVDPDAPCDPG